MQNNLKVVHLSTGHLGGAGLAARRLNQELIKSGVDSSFHAFAHGTFNPFNNEVSLPRSTTTKIISKITTYLDLKIGKKVFFSLFNHNTLDFGFFKVYKDKNTILHFHNFFNLTNQQTILVLGNLGYNVVVTLHDQRLFTGGCHYAFDCKGFESDCKNCPQVPTALKPLVARNMRHTRKLAPPDTKLFLIAPSKWMKEQVEKAKLVSPEKLRFIPNTLGSNFSSRAQKQRKSSKSVMYTLGIASMDLNSFIKGGDLVNILRIKASENCLPFGFVSMKDFEGPNSAEDFWSSIDCLLVLSRADNSPNVIHEAKSFGIPVVGSAVGGIIELLDPEYDFLVQNNEISAEQIHNYLENLYFSEDFLEKQSRMTRKFNHYVGQSIEEHLNFYRFMLESRG